MRFGGTPYGWERDMLRMILATLFRAGEIEVTYQGNRFLTDLVAGQVEVYFDGISGSRGQMPARPIRLAPRRQSARGGRA
jgi:hypothetical protein